MLRGRVVVALAATVVAAAGLSACGSSGSSGSSGGGTPFRIAGVLPLTGAFGPVGTTVLAGLKAQAETLNKQGGILGKQIQVDIKDSASDTQKAVSAMREVLADSSTVNAVVAEATGSLNAAVLPIVEPTKIISVTSGVLSQGASVHPYNFSFASTSVAETGATMQAIGKLGLKKIGIVGPTDDTGKAVAAAIVAAAPKFGFEVVGQELFDPTGKDYSAQLQKLRSEGAEVLTGNLKGTPIGVFANGLSNLGWDVKVVGNLGWGSSPLNDLVPAKVQPQINWAGAIGATRIDGKLSDAQKTFIQAIKDTGGSLHSITASGVGADMVTSLKYAFEKAGSLDQAAALKAMETMGADPTATKLPWLFFVGQGPKYSSDVHNSSNIDPKLQFALCQIGTPVDGTYAGTRL